MPLAKSLRGILPAVRMTNIADFVLLDNYYIISYFLDVEQSPIVVRKQSYASISKDGG